MIGYEQFVLAWGLVNAGAMADGHVLGDVERGYYRGRYGGGEGRGEWVDLCVVTPSGNNGRNGRYRRLVDGVARQQYPMSRIEMVFVDDASVDDTFAMTKLYMEKNYPMLYNRTTFIKN